ncbi:hypothetical protein HYALB_00009429 [Hymenoscyphus albidus]|uniref:N-acetyltransferase domain-containing protein n=1 Tax=Hymenoscyphus albidus TaxID=595503 RepID=A0A9N9LPW6_9HELO|nr:hypothetical protein HYALB_00009429 [Hymenoscyphus albidus]
MPVSISRLTSRDIPGAIIAIQEASKDDPYALFVFSGSSSKFDAERNRVSLGIRCQWGIRNALFYVAKDPQSRDADEVLGIAMWMPPRPIGSKETWGEWFEAWRLWIQQRYWIWKARQAEAQSEIWTDPNDYYFLNIMVVKPGHQGKGIGKALARAVTKQADLEGKRCYLESSRDVPNIQIYESMGFHYVKTMDCDDEGTAIKLYCVVREPKREDITEVENWKKNSPN